MYHLILGIQCFSIAALFVECWVIMRKWKGMIHTYLYFSCAATLINNMGYLLELLSKSEEAYFNALRLSYLGRAWIGFALLLFVSELVKRKVPGIVKILLGACNLGLYLVVFTTRETNLYYSSMAFEYKGDFPVFIHENAVFHHVWTIVMALYIVYGIVMLIGALRKEDDNQTKRCLGIVLLAISIQGACTIIQMLRFLPVSRVYDLTMLSFPVATILMLIAIFRYDLLEMESEAKQYAVNQLSEAIIAVDRRGLINFRNEPADALIPIIGGTPQAALDRIKKAIEEGKPIRAEGKVYTPRANAVTRHGKQFGTIFALADDTETYRYLDEIKEQKRIAERANKAKSAFLANMSHEIRTPINAILGMDEMIMRESREKQVVEYAENIESAGRTLLSIINDILDISKIEEGRMEIIPVDYDLTSVINDLVNMIQVRADDKGLALRLDVNGDIPKLLHGDEIRIKQIISNILTNAVKYTEKGSVTLKMDYEKLDEAKIALKVKVSDTGIGIKEEDLPKLFEQFERIEESRNRNIEGTGLGLNITKQLLTMMGSKLEVESEYGKGSVFSFTLEQEVVKWEPVGKYEETYRRALEGHKKYQKSFTAKDARVLVIDDTPMNLSVFKGLLKQTLIKIDTAESGDEGIALALKNEYDIIFIDHMMPHKDGIETLKELKAAESPSSGAVMVCLTANAVSGAREKYLEVGFDDYLTKPIDAKKLEQMLIEYLPDEKVEIAQGGEEAAGGAEPSASAARPKVLIVDDDEVIRVAAAGILRSYYDIIGCESGREGVLTAEREMPDLVLLDINLGGDGPDGFDVLRQLKANFKTREIPVMFITGDGNEKTEAEGFSHGASDFIRKPFVPEVLVQRAGRMIELYHFQKGLKNEISYQTNRADNLSLQMMIALSKTVDAKDHYTNGHSGRVAQYASEIARRLGKSADEQEKIYEMGLMHDIGKIGVKEEIINKPGRLSDDEFAEIKEHTVIGYDILNSITEMPDLAVGARSHHERFDGTGYPDGLAGEDIPEAARIICVADCYDAMTSTRTYSEPRSQADVRAELERCSGTQFDPKIAEVMIAMIDEDVNYEMTEGVKVPEELGKIAEINIESGLERCGTRELYMETLEIYASSVAGNADEIEGYMKAGDIKNATIKVHALKSTSRVIGALELGDIAEDLENAGNAGDVERLEKEVPSLLERYRALGKELLTVLGGDDAAKSLPEIGLDELEGAYTAIGEFISVADYDSALQIVESLGNYKVPESESECVKALIAAADQINYEEIERILSERK